MLTPFQKHLLNEYTPPTDLTLQDFIRKPGDPVNPEPTFATGEPIWSESEPETTPESVDGDIENEGPPIDIPQGLTPVDEDGDGEVDYYVDSDGNIYYVNWVVIDIDGQQKRIRMITYNQQGYNLVFGNSGWQLAIINSDGNFVLYPNTSIHIFPSGGIMFIYQDHTGGYWVTMGDPYASNPPTTWVNPLTGGIAGGDYVQYPSGWYAWLGIEFDRDGIPVGTRVPLVPGGGWVGGGTGLEQQGHGAIPNWDPGENEWGIMFGMTIPWPPPEPAEGGLRHRLNWSWFVSWYYDTFDEYPPEHTWPDDADWWDDFVEGQPDTWPDG